MIPLLRETGKDLLSLLLLFWNFDKTSQKKAVQKYKITILIIND